MLNTKDCAELYRFCCDHGHINVAHLITAAGQGEDSAIERLRPALARVVAATSQAEILEIVRGIDTARPDGAIARETVTP